MKFKLRKPNEKTVLNGMNMRVGDINKNITDEQLSIGVEPKLDIDGKIIGFTPEMEAIKREKRKYWLFGQMIELDGTLYGVAKKENGKFSGQFFMPDMLKDMNNGNNKKYLESLFSTALNLLTLFKDCMYWQMPARIISDVANQENCDPSLSPYIGNQYGMELLTNDEVKFSRSSLLQYVGGEIDVFRELLAMSKGEGRESDTLPLVSSMGPAFMEKDDTVSINNYQSPVKRFGKLLPAHGLGEVKATPKFTFGNNNGSKLDNAGKSALNLKK